MTADTWPDGTWNKADEHCRAKASQAPSHTFSSFHVFSHFNESDRLFEVALPTSHQQASLHSSQSPSHSGQGKQLCDYKKARKSTTDSFSKLILILHTKQGCSKPGETHFVNSCNVPEWFGTSLCTLLVTFLCSVPLSFFRVW